MRLVLIETIPFSTSPVQLTEGMRAPSGNPMVEGILATAKKKEKENQLKSKGEEGQVKQREMMAFAQTASKILEDKRQRLTQELTEDINKALAQIAKNKYNMVFVKPQVPSPGALIFSEGMDDVTTQVLGILNKDAPASAKKEEKK